MATTSDAPEPGMNQPLDTESPTVRVSVPMPRSMEDRIVEWGITQRPVLHKAAAARRLLEMALEAQEREQAKPK